MDIHSLLGQMSPEPPGVQMNKALPKIGVRLGGQQGGFCGGGLGVELRGHGRTENADKVLVPLVKIECIGFLLILFQFDLF